MYTRHSGQTRPVVWKRWFIQVLNVRVRGIAGPKPKPKETQILTPTLTEPNQVAKLESTISLQKECAGSL